MRISFFSVITIIIHSCNGIQQSKSIGSVTYFFVNAVVKYQSAIALLLQLNVIHAFDNMLRHRDLINLL